MSKSRPRDHPDKYGHQAPKMFKPEGEICSARAFWLSNWSYVACLGGLLIICLGLFLKNMRWLRNRLLFFTSDVREAIPPDQQNGAITRNPIQGLTVQPLNEDKTLEQQLASGQPGYTKLVQGNDTAFAEKMESFLRADIPYPVQVRGITLYLLWTGKTPPLKTSSSLPLEFQWLPLFIGTWPATRIFQKPRPGSSETPWLQAKESLAVIEQLLNSIHEIDAAEKSAYIIVHINELSTWKPHFYRIFGRNRKEQITRHRVDRQKVYVELLQELIEKDTQVLQYDWVPLSFEQYDRNSQRRGWLTIAPSWALLAGVNAEEVHTLANLIQRREASPGGINTASYEEVLRKVIQWNSTQDFFESVNRIQEMAENGQKSTRGQLWLNFTLAAIGILLAMTGIVGSLMITPLLLLVGASVMYACYANYGQRLFLWLGLLYCAVTIIVLIVIFWPFLLTWFHLTR